MPRGDQLKTTEDNASRPQSKTMPDLRRKDADGGKTLWKEGLYEFPRDVSCSSIAAYLFFIQGMLT